MSTAFVDNQATNTGNYKNLPFSIPVRVFALVDKSVSFDTYHLVLINYKSIFSNLLNVIQNITRIHAFIKYMYVPLVKNFGVLLD